MSALKPCPFCGGEPYDAYEPCTDWVLIGCPRCWVEIKRRKHGAAARAWNRRAPAQATPKSKRTTTK